MLSEEEENLKKDNMTKCVSQLKKFEVEKRRSVGNLKKTREGFMGFSSYMYILFSLI